MFNDRYSRQSFLGSKSAQVIATCRIGIVGAGGGGSHLVQQLAHLGFCDFVIYDPDHVEHSNLNRMVGAMVKDAELSKPKIEVADRVIRGLQPDAEVVIRGCRWQEAPDGLRGCHIVFGCVDGYDERRQLEVFCRSNLIPLIDIGLDVHSVDGEPPQMAGQIILSMPGAPCMHCFGFLTEQKLTKEAAAYGDAGIRPQVVWANGILASTAVGVAIDLVTDWTQRLTRGLYLQYVANTHTLQPHVRSQYLSEGACPHFPLTEAGDPVMRAL